jgi:hypothetical protein
MTGITEQLSIGDLPDDAKGGFLSSAGLPDAQREVVDLLVGFAGMAAPAPRPDVLLDERTEAARSALLADSDRGRWSFLLNVQLLGLLAWVRGVHTGDAGELGVAAEWLAMVARCGPAAVPEPLRSVPPEGFTAAGLAALVAEEEGADRALRGTADFVRAGLGWAATDRQARESAAFLRARALSRREELDDAGMARSAKELAEVLPAGHWLRPSVLSQVARSLGGAAWDRGAMLGDAEAVRYAQQSVDTAPPGHPHLPVFLGHLQLMRTWPLVSSKELPVAEVRAVVDLGRHAADLVEEDDPDRADLFHWHIDALGLLLRCDPRNRAVREEMLRCGRFAARLLRGSGLRESRVWSSLGTSVKMNYLLTGDLEVLGELIAVLREAERTAPPGTAFHAEMAVRLVRAEHVLAARRADVPALNAAAERYREVIETLGRPVPGDSATEAVERAGARAEASAGLREVLEARAQLLGDRDSRTAAIQTPPAEPALPPSAPGHLSDLIARRQFAMSRLAQATATLTARAARAAENNQPQEIRSACDDFRREAEAFAAAEPELRSMADTAEQLIAAAMGFIEALEGRNPRSAVEFAAGESNKTEYGVDLGRLVQSRYQPHEVARFQVGDAQSEAVAAVTAKQRGEPYAAAWSRALTHTRRLVDESAVSPVDLLPHAQLISRAATELDEFPAAAPVLAAAVRAAGSLASYRLHRTVRIDMLARHANGLGDEACAAALLAGEPAEQALALLESGRGLLAAARLGSMTDLGTLRRRFPDRAHAFEDASSELDQVQEPAEADQPEILERRHRAADRWEAELSRIRTLPGHEDFLEPLDPARLRALADRGPLVCLTLHPLGSHALLVRAGDVEALRLPDASADRARQWTARLEEAARGLGHTDEAAAAREARAVLAELWQAVAEPVLDALGLVRPASLDDRPRIWWVPSGQAAFLPLHAAGRFTALSDAAGAAEQLPDENVLDRVVSSYAPTLRALGHARLRPPYTGPADVLAVAAPGEPGTAGYLPSAEDEALDVQEAVGAGRCLVGEEASVERVLHALGDHAWLHFTGHATPSPEPPDDSWSAASGGLALPDGLLSPQSVDRLALPAAELAYLSGCGTARGTAALADESLHVAAALHLAGYQDVIGTLWPVRDQQAARTALEFYAGLRAGTGTGPAAALDATVRAARQRLPDRPELWAAYLHIGP